MKEISDKAIEALVTRFATVPSPRFLVTFQQYGGVYVNNLAEEGEEQVRAAYGPHYDRLVTVKNRYDPHDSFRLNANIKPTV